ncbi:hypothetical protein [Zavarzinella formosa]|uniref:hypothetical protein n=1 Tax=Zavarzinella formosa TaxID=360055 RepID=UPI0002F9AB3E|nr:hypothetical protein [Zavarzinella formosa]
MLGRFRYNPSIGVSFVFETEDGKHKVEITGNKLESLHRDLTLGRRESVRVGDAVTGIEVKGWSPPGKKG